MTVKQFLSDWAKNTVQLAATGGVLIGGFALLLAVYFLPLIVYLLVNGGWGDDWTMVGVVSFQLLWSVLMVGGVETLGDYWDV